MINTQTNYIKIRVALELNPNIDLTSDGFSKEFRQRLYKYEESFREQIIIPINEEIESNDWAIRFIEAPEELPFQCDIYANNVDDYEKIARIIRERISEMNFQFTYKGKVVNYLNRNQSAT